MLSFCWFGIGKGIQPLQLPRETIGGSCLTCGGHKKLADIHKLKMVINVDVHVFIIIICRCIKPMFVSFTSQVTTLMHT